LKKNNKKVFKTKQIIIKRMGTIFRIKINWNQMLIDEIENKIQIEKGIKNQKNEDQIWYKSQKKPIIREQIENQFNQKKVTKQNK
jgi:hypothetical protein